MTHKIDWKELPLGQVSDADLAKELGVNPSVVLYNRRKLGISPYSGGTTPKKIDWRLVPLGQASDCELAKQLNCSDTAVLRARHRNNISAYHPQQNDSVDVDSQPLIDDPNVELAAHQNKRRTCKKNNKQRIKDLDTSLLGTVPDRILAQQIGVTRQAIHAARQRRGIPPFNETFWDEFLLGTVPDYILAQQIGVSRQAIHAARQRRGIRLFNETFWDQQPLGTMPDNVLAQELQCSTGAVQRARKLRNILPFRKHKKQ